MARLAVSSLRAFVPVALIYGTLTALGLAAVLMNLAGQALIVNGRLRPDAPGPGLMVTSLGAAAVPLAVHPVLVAMVAVMTAGSLLGRPVPVGGALRRALGRSGPILALSALAGCAVLAALVLLALTPVATQSLPGAGLTYDLASVDGNGPAVTVAPGSDGADAEIDPCRDRECRRVSAFPYPNPGFGKPRSVALPDGTVAPAQTTISERFEKKDDERPVPVEIRLTRCTVKGRPKDARQSPVVAKVGNVR